MGGTLKRNTGMKELQKRKGEEMSKLQAGVRVPVDVYRL